MLKIKRIKLSGFRGILKPQELDLAVQGNKEPRSLVLYGLNSHGKTSFVDGLEWFLSDGNKIEWLRREDAEEKAYPHQAAKPGASFVEIEFYDATNKIGVLTKSYNHKKPTKPILSDEKGFSNIYSSYVIRPHLRYLEVIDFVYNRGAADKYQKLASWMGFENELTFQEKIALNVTPELKKREKELAGNVELFERQLKTLVGSLGVSDSEVLNFCNEILKRYKIAACKNIDELWQYIPEISKLKIVSSVGVTIDKLTQAETSIGLSNINDSLPEEITGFREQIENFRKEKKLIEQIDVISLYTQAIDLITKQTDAEIKCPVCGTKWKREKLIGHVKNELGLLEKVKKDKESIERNAATVKNLIKREIESVKQQISRYDDVRKIVNELKYDSASKYLASLTEIETSLASNFINNGIQTTLAKESAMEIIKERNLILEQIKVRKTKIQPSEAELKLSEDIEKLTQVRDAWKNIAEAKKEQKFTAKEIENFVLLSNELIKSIQENIKARFNETSARIGKYFGILRNDKDIKNIEIVLNEEKGRAAGRSAEIQLNYYDVSVKPAYKVLSESLLNSLGLAVYFTCIKQFNDQCKFIVLDDIMNSLDIEKRDTLLDLIQEEFSDYQIILLTHDYYWFQKIMKRFPDWISKKIKNWDYDSGAHIDFAAVTQKEIEDFLSDSTKIEDAGRRLVRHIEDVLNELCENLWAEVRYRYIKNDPPAMDELFDALYKRLKDKIKENPITAKVLETKKYEPVLRNFVSHARSNQSSSVSPAEVKRAAQEWFGLENEFWCEYCRRYVEYHKTKDSIECRCGKKKFEKINPVTKKGKGKK